MDKRAIASFFFAVMLLVSTSVFAGSGHDGKGPFMALFDTNADNVVTMEEFRKAAANRFKLMDADSNGAVTQEEFRSYLKSKREKRNEQKFDRIDTDKDGNISQSEYLEYKQKKAQSKFSRMDKNDDGIVSTEEFKNRRYRKWSGRHGKGGIFGKLDKNANGEITQDESLAAWTEWFKKIDNNRDQVVTAEEISAYRDKKFANK